MSGQSDAPAAVEIRIRRGWAVLEGLAAAFSAVAAGADIGAGEWLTGGVFLVLTLSLGFQTAQAWGVVRIEEAGVADDRFLGAGEVPWPRVQTVHAGSGGWLRPPLLIEVAGRARPVAASAPWSLTVTIDGDKAEWETARDQIVALARSSGTEVVPLGRG